MLIAVVALLLLGEACSGLWTSLIGNSRVCDYSLTRQDLYCLLISLPTEKGSLLKGDKDLEVIGEMSFIVY